MFRQRRREQPSSKPEDLTIQCLTRAIIRAMRRWLAIAALSSTTLLAAPLLAQMHGGSRGGGSMGGAAMGRGGFSSHGSAGFRGSPSFGSASHLGSAPRFGAAFGTGLRQPSLGARQVIRRFSPAGFRLPAFPSPRFLWLGVPMLLTDTTAIPPTTAATSTRRRIISRRMTTTARHTPLPSVLCPERHRAAATGHRSPGG